MTGREFRLWWLAGVVFAGLVFWFLYVDPAHATPLACLQVSQVPLKPGWTPMNTAYGLYACGEATVPTAGVMPGIAACYPMDCVR